MKYAFALAAIAGLAVAQPHGHAYLHRRQQAGGDTVTDWTVVTVTDVVTVYGPSPSAVAQNTDAVSHPATSSGPAVSSSSAVVAAPAPSSSAAPSPSSAPAEVPKPVESSSTKAAAKPSSAPAAAPAPAPASSAAAPATGSGNYGVQAGASNAANCPQGTPCKGDMTTFTPGLGACGYDDSTTPDTVVALQMNMFGTVTNSGPNSPSNPLCNKKIQITNQSTGATAVGVIRDRCPGCTGTGGIDLGLPLFEKLNAGSNTGRNPVEWYFLD